MTPEEARARLDALTPRQREVLVLRAQGLGSEGIALCMGISVHGVNDLSKRALRAIGVTGFRACWMVGRAGL